MASRHTSLDDAETAVSRRADDPPFSHAEPNLHGPSTRSTLHPLAKEATVEYELRQQVIEPRRKTFQNLVDRFGDKPASRYLEASIDIQPTENFHYRPLWGADRELY